MARIIRQNDKRRAGRASASAAPLRPSTTRVVRADQQQILLEAERLLSKRREQAEVEAAAIVDAARAQATGILVGTERRARTSIEQADDALLALAVRIAEKLIARQLQIAPETVVQIVARCLQSASASRQLLVRVNPVDLPQLDAALADLQQAAGPESLLALEPDEGIARGGCIVESDAGQVDGRLETQLRAIRSALTSGHEPSEQQR